MQVPCGTRDKSSKSGTVPEIPGQLEPMRSYGKHAHTHDKCIIISSYCDMRYSLATAWCCTMIGEGAGDMGLLITSSECDPQAGSTAGIGTHRLGYADNTAALITLRPG